jgi:8-oxo-dGTP pyrophosphatase MutT (NUDIX family)
LDKPDLRPWKTISRRTILDLGRHLAVESHVIQLPDGSMIEDWPWVIIPDAAIVLARTRDQRYLVFRQTKYAVSGVTLAPVGGMIEPGEPPVEAAKRELREEMGYAAGTWVSLGAYAVEPNRGVGAAHLFLALDITRVSRPSPDDLEEQVLLGLSRQELKEALFAGQFKVVSWAACVALALQYEALGS